MKMKALITGVRGFVGKYLADHLLLQGIEVWGTSREESPLLCLENGNVKIIKNDLDSEEEILNLLQTVTPDYIFHLAGQSNVKKSWEDKEGTFYANVNKTIFLLDACVRYQQENPQMRLLTVGSSEEYGRVEPHELPIKESTPLRPMSPYGATKAAVSMLIQQYHKAHELNVIHARPFNHIGPGQTEGFVTTDFAKQVVLIEKGQLAPTINVGDLSSERDFTDVKDIVSAYSSILLKGELGEIYNVCSGKSVSINNILNYFLSFSHEDIIINVDKTRFRPIEFKKYYGSSEKIKSELDWQSVHPIEDSLYEIYLYLKEQPNIN
ncbi:GDP-mannose 4,6-dehydratase [Lysinibacillus pakistanensis]|uniref:NAD-dependent epimerase/dehydratase family protein n=1 Tax=Lysinibacillus pakistanensis TaxID=759811 RepID=A0ABX6D5P7_9BACI|nr:NAD-dependent epimerase/dehydratase family protein [Lysinibacillus pakistanensis]